MELPDAGAAAAVDEAAGVAAVDAGAADVDAAADEAAGAAAVDADAGALLAASLLLPELLLQADNEKTIADAIAAARIVRVNFIFESPRTCRERGWQKQTRCTIPLVPSNNVLIA